MEGKVTEKKNHSNDPNSKQPIDEEGKYLPKTSIGETSEEQSDIDGLVDEDFEGLEDFGVSETFSEDDFKGLEDFNVQENFEDDIKLEGQAADFYNAVGESLGLDKKILSKATPQEIQELIDGVKKKQELQDHQEELDKKIEEAKKKSAEFAYKVLGTNHYLYGVFKNATINLNQYADYKDKFASKKEYYQSVIDDPNQSESAKSYAKSKLQEVEQFEQLGEEYLNNKDAWAEESKKYGKEYQELLEEQKANNAWIDKFNDKLAIYEDQSNPYSDSRREKAISFGFNAASSLEGGYGSGSKPFKVLGPEADKQWDSMTTDEKAFLDYYIGSYHWCNEPLRNISYSGYNMPKAKVVDGEVQGSNGGKEGFKYGVTQMTNALKKCKLKQDTWFQRWTGDVDLEFEKSLVDMINESGAQSVVGISFRHKNFASMGAAKGTGYGSKTVTMNLYCPKGTEAFYTGTTINTSSENEVILNRGYTMKIRKCEVKNGRIFIDVDVILGSNSDEVLDKDMKQALNYV